MDDENWVERRAHRERNLASRASEVWEDLVNTITACCKSYNNKYTANSASIQGEGEAGFFIVTVACADGQGTQAQIQLQFRNEPRPHISINKVIIERQAEYTYELWIAADEQDVFMEYQGQRISADDLSERVLKDAFFPS
jgi:hypothetical protein